MTAIANIMNASPGVPVLGTGPGATVPPTQAGRIRTPVLFLIDTSGSTGQGDNPDLPQIEYMLTVFVQMLSAPPATSQLGAAAGTVDIAIVTYNETPTLLQPFEIATRLPPLPQLAAGGRTYTGMALVAALHYIAHRIKYYDTYSPLPIPKAVPHIFHLTDGAPNDIQIGDQRWQEVQQLMAAVSGDKAKPFSMITHFISPNGLDVDQSQIADADGTPLSGYDVMSRWTGGDNVHALKQGPEKFIELARVIVKSIGGASSKHQRINDVLNGMGLAPMTGAAGSSARQRTFGEG